MKKHQLSRQYRLITSQDIADTDSSPISEQIKQGERYVLLDTASGERIILTETMYLFLKEYETPRTLEEVALFFARAFESAPQEVLPIIRQFLEDMIQRGVLLTPRAAERIEIIRSYPAGTVIDGYRIEENLSVNLPLEVYKATSLQNEQPVALKILRIPKRLSQKWREKWLAKFRKEFEIQRLLSAHPNVCQLLDLTSTYAASEWIEGVSFRRRLAEGDPADPALRQTWLSQILDAYAFMHQKNILHGDVHARNILLSGQTQIKIIDFDLAHQLTGAHTSPNVRGGAPAFVPPENIRFDAFNVVKGKANYRTEVYQLGLIAYWITYGKLPFAGDTWEDLATDILNKPIDFPAFSSFGDAIPGAMVEWLQKSLAKNPLSRFSSAMDMNNAFQKIASTYAFEKAASG